MYIDINLDTKNILQKAVEDSFAVERKKDLFDVNSFISFKRLCEFAEQINDIEKVSAEYNSVRQLEDRKSVADLTATLFKENFDIADEIKGRIPNKKLIPPKFDITLFKSKIETSLRTIFMAFLKDVLDVTIERILQNLSMDVEKILDAARNASSYYSAKDLAKIYNKTVLIADILKNKNFSWISKEHFTPCPEYIELINKLGISNAIDRKSVKDLVKTGELEFHKFKSRLLEYKTDLTEELLSPDIRTVSTGFANFQKEVRTLLDQPFICATANGKLNTTIPEDKMLIWDVRQLKELSNLIDKYYEFKENMPKDMRAQYFDLYKAIARRCFYPIIESFLGSAQILDDMPLGHSKVLLEDAYKRQTLNIRNASFAIPKIVKILDEIQEENSLRDFGFSSMVIAHYSALLERVDALFNQETPYSAGHAALDNWSNSKGLQSSGMSDPNEMKQYLTAQFERIRFLAKEIASPVVDLLSMPHLIENVKNQELLSKWKEIIANVNDYENKKPGNSIATLESFISDSLSKVSSGSFDEQGEIKTISESGGDYFLSKRSNVAKSLLSRTETIQYEKAADSYNKIHEFFNDNLAHKFPFGISDQDASLKDVEDYVNLYEENSKNITDILGRNRDKKQVNEKAIEFLKLMDNHIMPLLKTWVAHSKTSDANSALVTFNIQMRPSPDLEALTSSVVDREILIDNSKIADNSNGTFFNNNNVSAVFNWVSSSEEKPNEKSAGGNLLIQGARATFSYAGKWAMFRLIEENKTNKESESPNGILLQFNVPIVDASKGDAALVAKMIVKIVPMKKDGDKTSPMPWPIFPEVCPGLHNSAQSAATASTAGTNNAMDVNVSFDGPIQAAGAAQ
jgi:type VI secretion system protein ImpL